MSDANPKRKTKSADAGTEPGHDEADETPTTVAGQAAEVLSKAADATKDLGRRAAGAVGEQYGRMSRGTQDAYQAAMATGAEWEHDLEKYIRRNPITSLLVTAGVGLLIGFALGRQSVQPPPPRPWWRRYGG